jgi:hypothetical protein
VRVPDQALADESEAVVAAAMGFLTACADARAMRSRSLLAAARRVVSRLAAQPSTPVRAAAAGFLAAAARSGLLALAPG